MGPDCLQRLNGMFALAIYDADRDSLFLARDRLGVKPLFFTELGDGTLLFGSELKALLAHPRFRGGISPTAVEDYLAYGYVPDDTSILEGCASSPRGTSCWFAAACRCRSRSNGGTSISPSRPQSRKGAAGGAGRADARGGRSRMVADVPLGAFLSGGVDSSAVVAFMAEASKHAVQTCSIGFDQADHDETAMRRWSPTASTPPPRPAGRGRRFRADRQARRTPSTSRSPTPPRSPPTACASLPASR
jgi:asparagine synthase (glutamine-hydrolysing)